MPKRLTGRDSNYLYPSRPTKSDLRGWTVCYSSVDLMMTVLLQMTRRRKRGKANESETRCSVAAGRKVKETRR